MPFVVLAVLLGQPLAAVRCAAVSSTSTARDGNDGNGKEEGEIGVGFVVNVPSFPGTGSGAVEFPAGSDGRSVCVEVFAVWGLLIAVCVLLAVSAMAVGFLQIGERRVRREFWEVRSLGSSAEGNYGAEGPGYVYDTNGAGMSRGVGFAPTVMAPPPRGAWDGFEKPGLVERDEEVMNIPMGPERAGIDEDAVIMNRPITIARLRGGDGVFPRGVGYHDPLGPPATRRVYQGSRSYRSGSITAIEETAESPTRPRRADGMGFPSDPRRS